ncbi:SdpI family protein [Mariniflexile maritimum]|uniref:SdpI family protein n=1 Tax=Mariniflexile maritimum TaxID=2682493 RepID=UPI001E4C9FF2|nr:SdpI family protein [Mariniflexile maritimum]
MEKLITDNHLFIICFGFGIVSIIAGLIMRKFPPKKINALYGYRTSSSMKNQERWDFAQFYSSKEMIKIGLINIVVSFIGFLDNLTGTISMILGLTIMILSIIVLLFRVENSIKKKFK